MAFDWTMDIEAKPGNAIWYFDVHYVDILDRNGFTCGQRFLLRFDGPGWCIYKDDIRDGELCRNTRYKTKWSRDFDEAKATQEESIWDSFDYQIKNLNVFFRPDSTLPVLSEFLMFRHERILRLNNGELLRRK